MKATADTPGNTLSVKLMPSTFRPATTPYVHHAGKAHDAHPTGGIAAVDEAFGENPTLWGGWGLPSSKIGGTGIGVVAKGSDGAHGGTSTSGNKLAEGAHVGFHDRRTSPAGQGGAVIAVADAPATAAVAPMSDFGVTNTSLGRGARREPDSGSEMSLPPAAATLPPDQPHLARLSYTLVQLSTRCVRAPSVGIAVATGSTCSAVYVCICGSCLRCTLSRDILCRYRRTFVSLSMPSRGTRDHTSADGRSGRVQLLYSRVCSALC